MSISNCSAYSAAATTQAITGIVKPNKPEPSEVPVVQPVNAIQPLTKKDDQVEAANVASGLDPSTLAAVLGFAR